MSGRKLGLLALILAFGLSVEVADQARASYSLGPAGCRILTGRFQGPSFEFDGPSEVLRLGEATTVEVTNAFGRVEIDTTAQAEGSVTLRSVVFRPTRAEAREFAKKVELTLESATGLVRVGTNRDVLEYQQSVGFETHLHLRLPPRVRVRVRSQHGAIRVDGVAGADVEGSFDGIELSNIEGATDARGQHADIKVVNVSGALSLTTHHGSAELTDVRGAARIEVTHGNAVARNMGPTDVGLRHGRVRLDGVAGDVTIRGAHAPVEVRQVSGTLDVETSYHAIDVADVAGDLRAVAAHGRILAARIGGEVVADASYDDVVLDGLQGAAQVNVSHGGLRGTGLAGGLRAVTSGSDVIVLGFMGPLHVEAQRGSVRLVPGATLRYPVDVWAATGDVGLELAGSSSLTLEALAPRGELSVTVQDLVTVEADTHRLVGAILGGGVGVRLRADRGTVTVSQTDSDATVPTTLRHEQTIR